MNVEETLRWKNVQTAEKSTPNIPLMKDGYVLIAIEPRNSTGLKSSYSINTLNFSSTFDLAKSGY